MLEYTLFQPGLFLEYLAFPHKTAKYLQPLQTVFDFDKCRAIVVQGHQDAVMSLTSVRDLAEIIAKTVELKGQWPVTFGVKANRLTFHDIVAIGERVRGKNHEHQKQYSKFWIQDDSLMLSTSRSRILKLET